MRTRIPVAAALSVAMIGIPSAAQAEPRPPKPFASTLIVAQHSIGGITLGATEAKTDKLFPAKSDCQEGGCSYSAKGYSVTVAFASSSPKAKPTVAGITFYSQGVVKAAQELRTKKGIGIGSTVKQIKKAYPGIAGNAQAGYTLGHGDHITRFEVGKKRVDVIFMQDQPLG